jgi:hypothetical protein
MIGWEGWGHLYGGGSRSRGAGRVMLLEPGAQHVWGDDEGERLEDAWECEDGVEERVKK